MKEGIRLFVGYFVINYIIHKQLVQKKNIFLNNPPPYAFTLCRTKYRPILNGSVISLSAQIAQNPQSVFYAKWGIHEPYRHF
jgi:hypothetical protein